MKSSIRIQNLAAKILQSYLDKPHMLITQPTSIKRMVRITVNGKYKTETYYTRTQLRDARRKLKTFKNNNNLTVVRLWGMYAEIGLFEQWDNLLCAKAMKEGRDFHFAKYLMSPDSNK